MLQYKVKTGELSTKTTHTEISNVIVPCYYNIMKTESIINGLVDFPSHDVLLSMLGMKNISILTT